MPIDDDLSNLIGLPQAAQALGLHRATVNDMVLSGRLKGYRLGPHWFVRRQDVELFGSSYARPKNAPKRRAHEAAFHWTNEILRWLLHWHDATGAELDRVLDLHIGNVRKYLTLAEADGLVVRDDGGSWTLTEGGLERALRLPLIADPFAGSASTGVAAIFGGRKAVLVESDSRWLPLCIERLTAAEELADQMEALGA